jgi:hypothetical protein
MKDIGRVLGQTLGNTIKPNCVVGVITTMDEADYFSSGVIEALELNHTTKTRIIFNKHYPEFGIAPISFSMGKVGFNKASIFILSTKTISCTEIVRTNLMDTYRRFGFKPTYIVTETLDDGAFNKLSKEMPDCVDIKVLFHQLKIGDKLLTREDINNLSKYFWCFS